MANLIVSAGTVVTATGQAMQNHLIYAVNSARWWLFFIDSGSTTSLQTRYSSDLITWSAGASKTLNQAHNSEARNFAVAYKNISSNDVIHIHLTYDPTSSSHYNYHMRATISGTTITFEAENAIEANDTTTSVTVQGPNLAYNSANRVHAGDMMVGNGDPHEYRSTNVDNGSSWTSGFDAYNNLDSVLQFTGNRAFFDLGSTNMLHVWDNAAQNPNFTNVRWSKYTGTWSAAASIRGSDLGTSQQKNDFGSVARTTSDIHCVMRTASNTYEHFTFNGTSWSTGQSITNQTSKAGAGLFMTTDGTNVWLFIIDSDSPNTVRYCSWNGTWSSWTALESTTQTRSYVSGYQSAVNGTIAVIYNQVNGSNFDIYTTSIGGAAPVITRTFPKSRPYSYKI